MFWSWMLEMKLNLDFGLDDFVVIHHRPSKVLCRRDVDAVCPSSFRIILDFSLIFEHFLAKYFFFRQKSCLHPALNPTPRNGSTK